MQKKYLITIGIGGLVLVAGIIAAVVLLRRPAPVLPNVTIGGTVHTTGNEPAPAATNAPAP